MPAPIILCLDFLHSLLRERGLIGLCLADQSAIEAGELKKQFQNTDVTAEKLKSLPRGQELRLLEIQRSMADLPEARDALLAHEINPIKTMGWYGAHLIDQIEALTTAYIVQNPRADALTTYSLVNLLRWQILLADEREMGVYFASPEWLRDATKIAKLRSIAKEQQAYERLFFGLADETIRQAFHAAAQAYPLDTHVADETNLALTTDRLTSSLPQEITAMDWFAAFSAKIDILQNVARALVEKTGDLFADILAQQETPLSMDADVEAHYELIRTLPLFRGLSKNVLDSLLISAHLVRHEKGTLVLTQGETSSRLFIVLDGWMKLVKSAPSGEEAILHIAGKKEALLETNPFVPQTPSPVSLRCLTKVWLLSLSAASLREGLVRHRELATAFFNITNQRFQKLVGQYEQMTLRKAEERVGWFLLNLNKEFGIEGQPLSLPYDKALIASFLNIKPETFSRVLNAFRKKGFKIERDQITLPSAKALCDFCDYDIAGRCCHADQDECPRPDLRVTRRR